MHRGLLSPIRSRFAQVTCPLWGGTRNSAVTPIQNQGLKRQVSPYRTDSKTPESYCTGTPRNSRRGLLSPVILQVARVPSLLWAGIRNSALTLHTEPRLVETTFTLPHGPKNPRKLPHRIPINLRSGLPSPIRLRVAQVTSPFGEGPVIRQ